MKEIMTLKDVAEYTGWTIGYLYQLTSKSKIPHYKPGNGKLIFKRSEVDEFIFSNKKKSIAEIEKEAINFTFNQKK